VHIGVVLPQTEIGADTAGIRRYARRVEELGYRHVMVYEHVVGADPQVHAPWTRPYDVHTTFREPMVLFGYLAALTELELVTGILVLPQRQTVLVAKQAAQVDLLTGGHFRLGVGVGWNEVEYEALGMDFATRGRRQAEQIRLLRRLWTDPLVTFDGTWDRITDAGLKPLPVQRPIPIWIGAAQSPAAATDVVLRRIGRLADGWILVGPAGPHVEASWGRIRDYAAAAGRDPAGLGLHGGVRYGDGDLDRIRQEYETWRRLGASYVCVNTMGAGLASPDDHVAALRRVHAALS
jgi:probable F420-dependent oxidoreductase